MDRLNDLDLKTFIVNTMIEVFDTMLSMDVEPTDVVPKSSLEGLRIVGAVSFVGKVTGRISIQLSQEFARVITADMLGMELEETEGDEEVNDVIGELTNMVGGNLKSRLCDAGLNCVLSIPSTTSGSDFKIESKGWTRHERFAFKSRNHIAFVEVFMKTGS